MEMSFGFIVALCATLAVAGCVDIDACPELAECTHTLGPLFSLQGKGKITISSDTDPGQYLDNMCNELPAVRACVARQMHTCDIADNHQVVHSVMQLADHMCLPANRQDSELVLQSPCASNLDLQSQINVSANGCALELTTGLQSAAMSFYMSGTRPSQNFACPYMDDFKSCMVGNSTEICGQAMGRFVSTAMDIAMAPVSGMCQDNVSASRRDLERLIMTGSLPHGFPQGWPLV